MTNEFRYFLESNFVGVNRLFVLVYTIEGNNAIRFNARKYHLTKGITKKYIIINGKNVYEEAVDSDIKRYKQLRKLTLGLGENYTTGCLLDYDYIENYYRLITVDLSRQKN